jgi:ABC-type uncharacterized transport system ATPase subunit
MPLCCGAPQIVLNVTRFGPLLANEVAEFSAYPGEIVALFGENGAGKSTLCSRILYG